MTVENGSFTLAGKAFEFPGQSLREDDPEASMVARHQAGDVTITAAMKPAQNAFGFDVTLASDPSMPVEEILAKLYFDKKPADLTDGEKEKLEGLLETYTSGP